MGKATPTAKGMDEIFKLIGGSDSNQDVKDWLTTGVLPLNHAMSGSYFDGGFPVGRISEIYGGESSGKTLMATIALIETQRKGGLAVFYDFEHAFMVSRAITLGLDTDSNKWIYKQPETAEKGFSDIESIATLMTKHDPTRHVTVVIDSVASMVTEAEMKAGYEDSNMKTKLSLSALMSPALKLLAGLVSRTNVTLIFLNQTRTNPGVMFGDSESQPGGKAMKFYASLRIRLSKTGKIKEGDKIIGENVRAQCIKNKVHIPFEIATYQSNFETGIDLETTHINYLKELGALGDSSGYVEFEGKKRRVKELAKMCRDDKKINDKLIALFKEIKA
jgi:protein RecA